MAVGVGGAGDSRQVVTNIQAHFVSLHVTLVNFAGVVCFYKLKAFDNPALESTGTIFHVSGSRFGNIPSFSDFFVITIYS